MNLSPDERDLLTRIVLGEASDNPDERAGVAWNVLNRVGQPQYGDSIKDVIYQKNQYEAITKKNGPFYRFSPSAYADARAVVDSVASGQTPDPTGGAPNFLAASMPPERRPKWAQGEGQQIGKTIFYGGHPMMSQDEADQYLAELRSKNKTDSPATMSQDEADAYLKQIRGKRGEPQQQQVAGNTTATPPITGEQAVAPAENPAMAAFHALPPIVQQHPILAGIGGLAGGALASAVIPEGAAAAVLGGVGRQVIAPVARWGLGLAGLDVLSGGRLHETLAPRLIDLLTRGLEEGGGGSAP